MSETPRDTLWNRAVASMRTGDMDSALADLYQLLRTEPKNLDVRNKIRFIHKKLVGSWHFDMMNDEVRNTAYKNAIERAVTPGSVVFEIGTGSGLLSMMAARAGAKHVYTCEKALPIRTAAREIIKKNGFANKITIFDKWSTSVKIPEDIPERVDLVIAEIFGSGLLEEQAIHFFEDARTRLLKSDGKILPARATMFGALVESEEIVKRALVGDVCGFDLRLFNGLHDDPADQYELSKFRHKILSAPFKLGEVDFLKTPFQQTEEKLIVQPLESGVCHGVVQWFRLELDDKYFIDTGPLHPRTHWDQQIQVFEKPFQVDKDTAITFLNRRFEDRFSLYNIR